MTELSRLQRDGLRAGIIFVVARLPVTCCVVERFCFCIMSPAYACYLLNALTFEVSLVRRGKIV